MIHIDVIPNSQAEAVQSNKNFRCVRLAADCKTQHSASRAMQVPLLS